MPEPKTTKREAFQSFKASIPIILGYVVLGLPCGILCQKAGMTWTMVLAMSVLFYSGAGQYMIANLWMAGTPLLSLITSVCLVNTRQLLYGSALSPFCKNVSKGKAIAMASGVTDESFGVNLGMLLKGKWKISQATLVNGFSQTSWAASNVAGFFLGGALAFDTSIASFAMTSIFICLLMMQSKAPDHIIAGICTASVVVVCKLVGLGGPAILIGAVSGVAIGLIAGSKISKYKKSDEMEAEDDALV